LPQRAPYQGQNIKKVKIAQIIVFISSKLILLYFFQLYLASFIKSKYNFFVLHISLSLIKTILNIVRKGTSNLGGFTSKLFYLLTTNIKKGCTSFDLIALLNKKSRLLLAFNTSGNKCNPFKAKRGANDRERNSAVDPLPGWRL
jgi:hypothetical protein